MSNVSQKLPCPENMSTSAALFLVRKFLVCFFFSQLWLKVITFRNVRKDKDIAVHNSDTVTLVTAVYSVCQSSILDQRQI